MGQVLGQIQNKLKVNITEEHVRRITDEIYVNLTKDKEEKQLTRAELYSAVIDAFNKIGEVTKQKLPTPTPEEVESLIDEIDSDRNNLISKEEFARFVLRLSGHMIDKYLKNVVIVTVVLPLAAMATKKATQRIPVVGGLAQRVPYSFFLAATTSAALLIQSKFGKQEPSPPPPRPKQDSASSPPPAASEPSASSKQDFAPACPPVSTEPNACATAEQHPSPLSADPSPAVSAVQTAEQHPSPSSAEPSPPAVSAVPNAEQHPSPSSAEPSPPAVSPVPTAPSKQESTPACAAAVPAQTLDCAPAFSEPISAETFEGGPAKQ